MDSEELICITHEMDEVGSCFTRNLHFAACPDPDTCSGCVPRQATHYHLCSSCWGRLARAAEQWDDTFMPALGGEVRAVQPESGSSTSKPSSRLPLSPLQLTIDEVRRLDSRPGALYLWPSTREGAVVAVRFTRAIERAVRMFPTKEQPSKLTSTRCPQCKMRTLVYQPAPSEGADASVQCLNCHNVMDHTAFERIALIEAQCCRRCRSDEGCTNESCTCHTFAPVPEWERTSKGDFEPFDITQPDHRALRQTPQTETRGQNA